MCKLQAGTYSETTCRRSTNQGESSQNVEVVGVIPALRSHCITVPRSMLARIRTRPSSESGMPRASRAARRDSARLRYVHGPGFPSGRRRGGRGSATDAPGTGRAGCGAGRESANCCPSTTRTAKPSALGQLQVAYPGSPSADGVFRSARRPVPNFERSA